MKDFDAWLHAMAHQSLPGGLSAAAVAAAMGSALIFKALRTSLERQKLTPDDQALLAPAMDLVRQQQDRLLQLADADENAYLAVLAAQESDVDSQAIINARRAATEIPIRTAQTCTQVIDALPPVKHLCWPTVMPDVDVGEMLLETGRHTGILIAEANLRVWGDTVGTDLRFELDSLAPSETAETRPSAS